MVQREIKTESINVPKLVDLCASGIVNRFDEVFEAFQDDYFEMYPILKQCDMTLMPVYLTYTSLCNSYLLDDEKSTREYAISLSNTKQIIKAVTSAVKDFAGLLVDLNINEDNMEENYEIYKDCFLQSMEKDPKIVRFQKSLFSDVSTKAVKNYIFSTGGINVEKLGVNLTYEETIDLGVYIFYKCIYNYYLEKYKNNPIGALIYKRKVKNIEHDKAVDLANIYLKFFDDDIFTFEEFVLYIRERKSFATSLLLLSQEEFDEYQELVRKRKQQ